MTGRAFDPEQAAAELLDAAIDAERAGARPDADADLARVVRHLAVIYAAPAPDSLGERVARGVARASAAEPTAAARAGTGGSRLLAAARAVAVVLAALFAVQGVTNVVAPEWLAAYLKLQSEPHVYREAGFAFVVVSALLIAGAIRPRMLTTAAWVGVPLALALGGFGMVEIGHSPKPSAEILHFEQAVAGLLLAGLLVAHRRRAGRTVTGAARMRRDERR